MFLMKKQSDKMVFLIQNWCSKIGLPFQKSVLKNRSSLSKVRVVVGVTFRMYSGLIWVARGGPRAKLAARPTIRGFFSPTNLFFAKVFFSGKNCMNRFMGPIGTVWTLRKYVLSPQNRVEPLPVALHLSLWALADCEWRAAAPALAARPGGYRDLLAGVLVS